MAAAWHALGTDRAAWAAGPPYDEGYLVGVDIITPGSFTLAGQTITAALSQDNVVNVDAGVIIVAGQSAQFAWVTPWDEGNFTIAGQQIATTLAADLAVPVTAGALTFTGQTITVGIVGMDVAVTIDATVIALQGQEISIVFVAPGTTGTRKLRRSILSRRRYSRG